MSFETKRGFNLQEEYWSQHEIAVLELVKFLHALSTAISDFYNMSEYSI